VIAEVDVFGVFLTAPLVAAILAGAAHLLLRRVLRNLHFYEWVWHRNLADIAVYVLLWGVASVLLPPLLQLLNLLTPA
jgi:uncharacterized protein DUF1656